MWHPRRRPPKIKQTRLRNAWRNSGLTTAPKAETRNKTNDKLRKSASNIPPLPCARGAKKICYACTSCKSNLLHKETRIERTDMHSCFKQRKAGMEQCCAAPAQPSFSHPTRKSRHCAVLRYWIGRLRTQAQIASPESPTFRRPLVQHVFIVSSKNCGALAWPRIPCRRCARRILNIDPRPAHGAPLVISIARNARPLRQTLFRPTRFRCI